VPGPVSTALFPRWTNTAVRFSLAGALAGVVLVPVALMIYVRTPYSTKALFPTDQPVEFDHRHHVVDDEIDCRYCHRTVEKEASAGYPATEVCMGCHNQIRNESVLLEPVRRSWFADDAVAWNRVHDLPDFVQFNHAIHVSKGYGCVECHGRVDRMARVYQVAPLTMGWCLDCHRNPEERIRPREHVTDMSWEPEGVGRKERAELASRYGVRSLTHCTACHR
jgi:hypothetical protein